MLHCNRLREQPERPEPERRAGARGLRSVLYRRHPGRQCDPKPSCSRLQRGQLREQLRGGGPALGVRVQAGIDDALERGRRLARRQPPQVAAPHRRLACAHGGRS